jgi:hypothetical protein
MRYQLTTVVSFVFSFAPLFVLIGFWPGCAQAADVSQETLKSEQPQLQNAIDIAGDNPKNAEKILVTLHSPSAKAYLAYLYMSGKIAEHDSTDLIDTLMHAAVVQVCSSCANPNSAVNEIFKLESEKRHYSNMSDLLYDLRSITDYGDSLGVSHPAWLFKEHPVEAFSAFSPRYGSSLDYGIGITLSAQDDIRKLPATASLIETLKVLCGRLAGQCEGTIRNYFGCLQQLAILEASLAPQVFLVPSNNDQPESKTFRVAEAELERFMKAWSDQELWNKQKYKEWMTDKERCTPELVDFYIKRLKLEPAKALICAKAAVNGISLGYLGSHERALVDSANNAVHKMFSQPQLTCKKMNALPLRAKEELAEALRLAILNQADLAVIEDLVKLGAPVNGGRETPLFTAVLRPEVEELLLKAGAKVNETNPIGKTALIQAAQYNALESMKILVSAGADINHAMIAVDSEEAQKLNCDYNYTIGSRTPLMYAAWFADYPAINYLIAMGADKAAVDSDGSTALKYLEKNKRITESEKDALARELRMSLLKPLQPCRDRRNDYRRGYAGVL